MPTAVDLFRLLSGRSLFATVKGTLIAVLLMQSAISNACDHWFTQSVITESTSGCDDNGWVVCLPLPYNLALDHELSADGEVIPNTSLIPCDFDSLFFLPYGSLPGQGADGPYAVLNWTINGETFSGEFEMLADLLDSLNIWDPTGNWTLDISNTQFVGGSGGYAYSDMQVQQLSSGQITSLPVSMNLLPQGTQLELPFGNYWMTLSDGAGCIDSLDVRLFCLSTDSRVDTLVVGQTTQLCLDAEELPGTPVEVFNSCPGNSASVADWMPLPDPNCIEVTGLAEGLGLACLVQCDDLGLCDTTLATVQVFTEATIGPLAMDDLFFLPGGLDLQAIILENDLIRGPLTAYQIVVPPAGGEASLLPDGSFSYSPNPDFCGLDSLAYEICNPWACDQAWVHIEINCGDLLVYDGFSPNGDGVNETFVIEGIDRFPGSHLEIFDRYGVQVYAADGYQNDWDGTWRGKALPAGTYYYFLELEDGRSQSGRLQLQR